MTKYLLEIEGKLHGYNNIELLRIDLLVTQNHKPFKVYMLNDMIKLKIEYIDITSTWKERQASKGPIDQPCPECGVI